jgi:excisionase family DNA binding protein
MIAMNSRDAREFLLKKGIPMSKSKFYKLTSSYEIIFHRVGNRLLFYKKELEGWCDNQIVTPQKKRDADLNHIIQSAQKSRCY